MRSAVFVLALLAAGPAAALEIASGSMLGPRYKQDRFYVRTSPGGRWTQTNESGAYQKQARGSLALLRLPQGLFDDEWLAEKDFDPDANTERLIGQLDLYKEHGVGGIIVSLQGADPGYDADLNGITRGRSADLGEKSGSLISAFNPDGSLKPEWMARLDKLITETNRRGMVVCLTYFQQYQDEVFESPQSVVNAARNITRHLIELDARNVMIDIADAWDAQGDSWDHRRFIARNVANLIRVVREQFQEAEFSLPIGASTSPGMLYPSSLAHVCDVVMLQGNGRSAADKLARSRNLEEYDRPVIMVSDSNGPETTPAALKQERAGAEAFIFNASGWSFLPAELAGKFPFEYEPAASAALDGTPDRKVYFRAMLEEIAMLVLRKPPSSVVKKK